MCLQSHQPQMSRWQMGYLRYHENSKWPTLLWHHRNRHWAEGWGCRCSKLPDSDSLAVFGEGKHGGSSHHGSKLHASWNHIHNHLEMRAVQVTFHPAWPLRDLSFGLGAWAGLILDRDCASATGQIRWASSLSLSGELTVLLFCALSPTWCHPGYNISKYN